MAPVVVFAAAIEPGNPSDVAVGLALAAHMAEANNETVSLVVIPHYLESDQELENTLESQHELVTGGVVLGETPTVPEDTRVLLRQLLTSTDRQGVAAQLQANLGSVASLIAALLALGGLAAAARIAGPVIIERLERARQERIVRLGKPEPPGPESPGPESPGPESPRPESPGPEPRRPWRVFVKESDWLTALGSKNREVIIWLRSGRQVAGTIESQFPRKARNATVLRIKKTPLESKGAGATPDASPRRTDGAYVLVSIQDIELIHFNDLESETGKGTGS